MRQLSNHQRRETDMNNVIPLAEQIRAKHRKTGRPVTVVGVDTTGLMPRLVIINRGPDGISAEIVDDVDVMPPAG